MGRYPIPNGSSSSSSSRALSPSRMLSLLSSKVVLLVSLLLLSICCSSSRVSAKEFEFRQLNDSVFPRVVMFSEEECYSASIEADMDGDRKVDPTEYVDFLQLLGPADFLAGLTEYAQLPFILKINFGTLACLCRKNGGAEDCCKADNAHISNAGAGEGETPTPEQEDYLFNVCTLTETAINRVIASQAPSLAPVLPPSDAPSAVPSLSTTPTLAPTNRPTLSSVVPTVLASDDPTNAPSTAPTNSPSTAPTSDPTRNPTRFPTASPTSSPPTTSPTTSPSKNPTTMPSMGPTKTASASPTDTPTVSPTASPSTPPTVSSVPSSSPTTKPTTTPTVSPVPSSQPSTSNAPTVSAAPSVSLVPTAQAEPDQVARTTFLVGVRDGLIQDVAFSLYVPDLILSLNNVAVNVSAVVNANARRLSSRSKQQQQSRRLQIDVQYPTSIDGLIETICPDFVDADDRCEEIFASVGIFCLDSEQDTTSCDDYASSMESGLETAILEGQLAAALAVVNSDSPVFILTGVNGPDGARGEPSPSDTGLSAGGITGLVAAGLVAVLLVAILLVRSKRGERYYSKQGEGDLEEVMLAGELEGTDNSNLAKSMSAKSTTAKTSRAVTMSKSSKSSTSSQNASKDMDNDGHEAYVKISGGKEDNSSNAGSSGWSSHGGMSSIDTSSVDDETSVAFSTDVGMTLAALGAASHAGVFRTRSSETEGDDSDMDPQGGDIAMTYSQLDRAISKGDWAAVGVSAALLASSTSFDTKSQMSNESTKSPLKSTIDAKRAAELDRLVGAGDWEGVVNAAAKYDQQGENTSMASSSNTVSSVGSSTKLNTMGSIMQSFSSVLSRSSKGGSSVGSQSSKGSKSRSLGEESAGSGAGRSAFTSQTGDSAGSGGRSAFTSHTGGTTLSQAKKRAEIRDEVETLVRRVVPEEVDNIDEMMAQFHGREEELVETLRTMQERAVAQKARLAGQKQAKREAKQMIEGKAEPLTMTAVAADGGKPGTADDSWIKEIDKTPQTPERASAASGLLGASGLTPPKEEEDTDEMENALRSAIDAGDWGAVAATAEKISVFDNVGDGSSQTSTSGSDPTQELNALVDKGDWEGVVKAASKFGDETDAERRTRRGRRLRDEQEALAQADIWDAIAEQAKSEAAKQDTGASDAADWAIARSLSALVRATEDGKLQDTAERLDPHAEKDEDDGEGDQDDRESV